MKNLYIILITVFLFQTETKITAQNPLPLNPKILNTEAEVGTLSGTFAVGQTGAATYTIPIDLPEGRVGMTPKLSLVYNSQAGDGILGKGWSISGWTYVDRVPETFYYNDNPGSIDFDEDQYTLDGKRLIFVADLGGTYSEVEYRTEQDEISKIIQQFAYKKDRTHSKFFVYTKSGIIKEYGTFENSLQVYGYNNNEAIRYHLSRIIDKKHNYIKYHYQRDITEGELYLDSIEYTGNDLTGKDPFYTVKFEYTPNDTKFFKTSYFAKGNNEYHYRVSQKLNAISIYYLENEQETLIKRYVIFYSDGGIFNKPYVTGIYLENENNQLNSTEFQWNFNEAFEFNEQHVYSTEPVLGHIVNMLRVSSGDFNGDGISDIIEGDKQNGMDLRLGGSLSSIESHSQDNISDHRYVVDINCDGKDELLVYWAITGYGRLYSFVYNGSQYEFNFVGEVYGLNPKIIGDFNGDKMQDFIVEGSGSNLLYLGTPNINEFLTNSFSLNYLPELTNYEIGDFNGDGKTDIIEINLIAATIYTLKHGSSGYYFEEYGIDEDIREEASVTFTDISAGDFNGDGRDDLLITRFFENDDIFLSHIYYSYGKEFITAIDVSPLSYYNKNHVIVDLNYDGISDILTYTIETNVFPDVDVRIRQSKYYKLPGTNQSFEIYTGVLEYDGSTSNEKYLPESFALGDFSGNGELDMYYTLIFELDAWEKNPPPVYWQREAYKVTEDLLGDDLITSITNGFGSIIYIQYSRFINSGSEQGSPTEYPVVNFTDPFYMVTQIESNNGQGGTLPPIEYIYKGAKFHAKGKGFLGFQNTTIKNYQNNTITSAEFSIFADNDLYFHPYPENIKQHSFINNQRETDKLLMETQNSFNIKTTITGKPMIYIPVITQSLQKVWDNDDEHTFVKTIKTIQNIDDFDLDIYGNSIKQTILNDPENLAESAPNSEYDFKTIVENLYIIDEPNWLVGRPGYSKVTNSYVNNYDNITETEFLYYQPIDADWPLLKSIKVTPNQSNEYTTEVLYEYDEYGNMTKETHKASDSFDPKPDDRVTEYEYDNTINTGYNARFLTKTINKNNLVEYATQYEYYKEFGKLKKEIVVGGPIPLETTYEYDDFGKHKITHHPDGTSSETYFFWSEGNDDAPLNALFYTINHKIMAGPIPTEFEKVITFYDNLERDLRQVTYGLNNEKIYVEKEYNAKGQLWKVSEPYFSTSSPQQWTVFEYDKLGRKKTTTTPANSYTYNYCGKTTTTTNNGTEISVSRTVNAIGNIKSVVDPAGPVSYEYYSSGNVKSINALGSIYNMEYDHAGNQNKLIDPNAGTITYKYNPFGELTKQEDARGYNYIMDYDNLGRLISKTLESTGEITVYEYYEDLWLPGFGLLRSVSQQGKRQEISYIYGYDDLNRLHSKTVSAFNEAFVTQYTYDGPTGRLKSHIYPTGFSVFYEYTNSGHLRAVKKTGSGETLWEANTANARGQLTDFTLGNGLSTHKDFDDYGLPKTIITGNVQDLEYSFDPVTGNLNYRKDHIFNLVENFEYDNLLKTRLIEWEVYGLDNYSIEYENNGNIHIKTDVTNIQTLPKGEYVYGQNAGQHAVTSIFKPTEEYLLKATPPQTIEYTPFNKTKSISKTVIEHDKTHIYRMDISYGPYQKRKATQFYKDKTLLSSKCFIGDNYEIETERDGTKRKLHYLSGGDGLFAIYESKDGENKMYYIHKDYLGSYETVTDEQGVIWDKLSFDPWGRRRNPFTWLYEDTPIPAIFDRGYTGHEHLDKFELINMGGRVYDPVLARFLSPDPFVQAPEYGQNYNRYSYAFNNPLKFTDPNGECGFLIFVGLSALMSAILSGSQPDGSFDWGEAGKGAFIGAAMPVGMMGSVLAPYSPALLGVSGALGSAALAGGAMFGSVTLTTGATSFATNGTFSPNLKAAGISAGITALFAGIEGGVRAANDNRNFWTGEGDYVPTYQTDNSPHTPLSVEVQQVELETSLAKMRTIPEDRLLPPVDIDYPVTSPYSEGNRYIEQLNQNRPHRAIDIGTPFGTPIQGPASGTVTFAGQTNYGKVVMLDHNYYYQGLQLSTSYSHLSSISVTQGMQIQMGQIIGYTGTYGTGPHLHFVVRIGGQRINPLLLFPYR